MDNELSALFCTMKMQVGEISLVYKREEHANSIRSATINCTEGIATRGRRDLSQTGLKL